MTLYWISLWGLLSGRIQTFKDDTGAIFIDRDPQLFRLILNYLRNRTLSLDDVNLKELKHEAEYYGIAPLVKKLALCEVKTWLNNNDNFVSSHQKIDWVIMNLFLLFINELFEDLLQLDNCWWDHNLTTGRKSESVYLQNSLITWILKKMHLDKVS